MFRMSSKKALSQELRCKIRLLQPEQELEIGYSITSTGQDLFNSLVKELDLLDKDYFGLKLQDQSQWLDLTKSIIKQTKRFDSIVFELRFKYYPAEPALLANESTRYLLYLQLRLDLIEGRLRSESHDTLAYLIACILQSELGDHATSNQSQKTNYVSEFKFVPNQTEELEWAAIRWHKNEDFVGLQPADSELNFLKKACQLDTYGIDPFPVKDGSSQDHYLIGVNHLGIATFQDYKLISRFTWEEIERLALDNKIFLIYCRRTSKKGGKIRKPLFGFRSPTQSCAQNLWKITTEHRYFFTLESTPELPIVTNTGGIFKKSKLKYTGRVEKDLLRDHVDEYRSNGVKRSHSLMSKSVDGPRWRGYQSHNLIQNHSMNDLYSSPSMNKTLPANMNYFKEEEEDEEENLRSKVEDQSGRRGQQHRGSMFQDTRERPSIISLDPPKTFTRDGNISRRSSLLVNNNRSSYELSDLMELVLPIEMSSRLSEFEFSTWIKGNVAAARKYFFP